MSPKVKSDAHLEVPSRDDVCALIDKAEEGMLECWNTLFGEKSGPEEDVADSLIHVQSRLAETMYPLNEMHRAIHRAKNELIALKSTIQPEWFGTQLALLGHFDEWIGDAILIVKAMGDSFAWHFCEHGKALLPMHGQHPSTFHIPGGLGGEGELSLIHDFPILRGHFVLYHNITSILRAGDISLVDLASGRVAAIAEIKTISNVEGRMKVEMYFISPANSQSFPTGPADQKVVSSLPRDMVERLGRQLKKIAHVFSPPRPGVSIPLSRDSTMSAFRALGRRLKTDAFATEQCGTSIVLLGIRNDGYASLSQRILCKMDANHKAAIARLNEQNVGAIIDNSRADILNRLEVGHFDFSPMPGRAPALVWPVDRSFLKSLLFHENDIITLFNPAHLLRKIKDAGFDVTKCGEGKLPYRISKVVGDRTFRIDHWEYFCRLVSRSFVSVDAVVRMLNEMVASIETGKAVRGQPIELTIQLEV
ncbi:MAG: hypothetical protein ACJ8C4_15265 [Gemmataceae bacterium]